MPHPKRDPAAPSLDLDEADLYVLHRAHIAVDAAIGALGRRWGADSTTVLILRGAAGELRDTFFTESLDTQRTIIGEVMTEERRANEVRLHQATDTLKALRNLADRLKAKKPG